MTTQRAVFNYEEVIDLHTEVGRVSVIGIHTPTGNTPRRLCPGFFDQFKKYKYVGCSVSLVPAATLPADPAQVSIGAGGDPEIDARDMLNPVMFHGCHGNDLGNILNRIYTTGQVGGSDLTEFLGSDSLDLMNMSDAGNLDILESLYYRALTDNTWKKAHIQRGFRKSGLKPRIYSLATNMQIQNASSLGGGFDAPGPFMGEADVLNSEMEGVTDPSVNPIRYFTPRTVPLGWLDTRQVVPYDSAGNIGDVDFDDLSDTLKGMIRGKTVWNELPKVFMGVIMLPPAYKTEFYFRMIINHVFAFAGFRGISMSNDLIDMPPNYENWNDALSSGDSDDPDDPEPEPPEPVGDPYIQYVDTKHIAYFDAYGTMKVNAALGNLRTSAFVKPNGSTAPDITANSLAISSGTNPAKYVYRKDPDATVLVGYDPSYPTVFTALQDMDAVNDWLGDHSMDEAVIAGSWSDILKMFLCTEWET